MKLSVLSKMSYVLRSVSDKLIPKSIGVGDSIIFNRLSGKTYMVGNYHLIGCNN